MMMRPLLPSLKALHARHASSSSSSSLPLRAAAATAFDLFTPNEEIRGLRESVRAFAAKELEPGAKKRDREELFDIKLFRRCGELGLLGVTVPEAYGGSGMDALAACVIHEELSYVDPGFTLSYLAHSMLFVNNVAINGNEAQKREYLPKTSSGEWIGGMGMSEPNYGTDVLGIETTAKRVGNGNKWVLNGRKFWITNGTVDDKRTPGDVFLIYAKTSSSSSSSSSEPTAGNENKKKSNSSSLPNISMFLVRKGDKGFSVGQRIKDKCGMRCSPTAELVFEDVELDGATRLVGIENKAIVCMMRNLEIERVTLAAMATGLARRCLDEMNAYATARKAFGKPIREFGQIQRYLGESYAEYSAARTYLYDVARRLNLQEPGNRLETDGVKLMCTQMGKRVADNAIQVLGGAGYIGDFPVERLWRDAKLLEIGGGTLEAHQKNMAREMRGIEKF